VKELFVSILAHTAPHLPNIILRRMYPAYKLASGIHFSLPSVGIELDATRCELRLKLSVVNVLPFDVTLRHLELEIQPRREFRLASVQYSRDHKLKAQAETILESPTVNISEKQARQALQNSGALFWLGGESDLQAPFGTNFTVYIRELNCLPNVY